MAIDTRNERASACMMGMPFRQIMLSPSGSIIKEDRAHVCAIYTGIAVGGAAIPIAAIAMTHYRRRRQGE